MHGSRKLGRAAIAMLVVTGSLLAIGGCGSDGEQESGAAAGETSAVPAGVAAQYATIEEEVGAEGGETESGPWRIAYIVEPAEPWFEGERFREPAAGETHHIEILPIEAETGRVVPNVPVRLEVRDAAGRVVDANELELFYAEFFHYANNFSIPEPGTYTLRATIEPPTFLRHGEQGEEPPLAEGATVEFADVRLEPEG